MNRLIVVLAALLIPVTAMAQGECKQDRQKFCKGAAHIGACLDQHMAELSEACKAMRQAKGKEKKATEGSAQMGKEEAHHAPPGSQPLTRGECDKAGLKWNDQSNVCG
jgi:hypothetical protein